MSHDPLAERLTHGIVSGQGSVDIAHHVDPSAVDYVYAGTIGARFNALMSVAVDATILLPPFSLSAEQEGLSNPGLAADSAKDLPFTGAAVNTNWAARIPMRCGDFWIRTTKAFNGSSIRVIGKKRSISWSKPASSIPE